jgi:hypothetical protein
MAHAEIDTPAQSGHRAFAISVIDIPGPLPNDGRLSLAVAKFSVLHVITYGASGRTIEEAMSGVDQFTAINFSCS